MWGIYIKFVHSIEYSNFTCAGDVWFSLNGRTYQNNSCVALEDIGEGDNNSLLCVTNQTACCKPPYTDQNGSAKGNWYFPNGTKVLSSSEPLDFYRTRGQMVVHLNRRRGGEDGIYPAVRYLIQRMFARKYPLECTQHAGVSDIVHFCSVQLYCSAYMCSRRVGVTLPHSTYSQQA